MQTLGHLILATTFTETVAQYANLTNIFTFFALVAGAFFVWRSTSAKVQEAIATQTADTIKSLQDARDAASSRADEEEKRANAAEARAATWELKNAELTNSAVADQTRFLVTLKTMAKRVVELEAKVGEE